MSTIYECFRNGIEGSPLYSESERKLALWVVDSMTDIMDRELLEEAQKLAENAPKTLDEAKTHRQHHDPGSADARSDSKKYPINSTAKVYWDADGNECSLNQLIKREPEWAYSRIKRCEQMESDLSQGFLVVDRKGY